MNQRPLDRDDPDQRDDTENKREVVYVRADDIADRDVTESTESRVGGDDQFGCGGARSDNSQTDREFGQADAAG